MIKYLDYLENYIVESNLYINLVRKVYIDLDIYSIIYLNLCNIYFWDYDIIKLKYIVFVEPNSRLISTRYKILFIKKYNKNIWLIKFRYKAEESMVKELLEVSLILTNK